MTPERIAGVRHRIECLPLRPWDEDIRNEVTGLLEETLAEVERLRKDNMLFGAYASPASRSRGAFDVLKAENEEMKEELEIHRATNRPCLCPDASNTPHVKGCPHYLRVLKERNRIRKLLEKILASNDCELPLSNEIESVLESTSDR